MTEEPLPIVLSAALKLRRFEAALDAAVVLVEANDRLKNAFCYVGRKQQQVVMDGLMEDQQRALNELRVALTLAGRYKKND